MIRFKSQGGRNFPYPKSLPLDTRDQSGSGLTAAEFADLHVRQLLKPLLPALRSLQQLNKELEDCLRRMEG